MKISLNKMIVTSSLAIALATIILLPARSVAYDGAKGGAQALVMKPISTPKATLTPAGMSCPSCKEKLVSYNASGKPSVKDIRTVSMHDCVGCKTALTTAGFGKAKTTVAVHTCSLEGNTASCCQ